MGSVYRCFTDEILKNITVGKYLVPDPDRVEFWKQRLSSLGKPPYIGVSWKSSNKSPNRKFNYAKLIDLLPILKLQDVTFINLQYIEFEDEISEIQKKFGIKIHNFKDLDHYNDIDDVAALVKALDVVVSTKVSSLSISAGVGTLTKLASWKQSTWNNVLWDPLSKSLNIYERNTLEPWENIFDLISKDLIDLKKLNFRTNFNETSYKCIPSTCGQAVREFRKNTRDFAGVKGGLCRIKLEQLVKCDLINTIYISTNDHEVIKISNSFNTNKIKVITRPTELASSSTSTDELIKYVSDVMPKGHILWTHVTSPFINSKIYSEIISSYFYNLKYFDSLMTVTKIQKFIWDDSKPINYDRNLEKWPRTQTIKNLWEINSGAFIASDTIYKERLDRIGEKPFLFKLSDEISFDIDWQPDFKIAEAIYYSMYNISKIGKYEHQFNSYKVIIFLKKHES